MKVKQIGSAKPSNTGFQTMPADLRDKLNGLTVNEALDRGILTDIGTDDGTFCVPHKDPNINSWYAIVQNSVIVMSARASELAENGELDDDTIGKMRFSKGVSNVQGDGFGKEWFNLGLGGVPDLDYESADAVKIGAQPVDHK